MKTCTFAMMLYERKDCVWVVIVNISVCYNHLSHLKKTTSSILRIKFPSSYEIFQLYE